MGVIFSGGSYKPHFLRKNFGFLKNVFFWRWIIRLNKGETALDLFTLICYSREVGCTLIQRATTASSSPGPSNTIWSWGKEQKLPVIVVYDDFSPVRARVYHVCVETTTNSIQTILNWPLECRAPLILSLPSMSPIAKIISCKQKLP